MPSLLPVSAAIRLPRDPRLREASERALAAIDRVHLAEGLPSIALDTRRDDPRFRGQYRVKRNSGRALGIGIDPGDRLPEFAIVHEIGHFVDHQALGRPGAWASISHSELTSWRHAVERTASVRRLRELLRMNDIDLTQATHGGRASELRESVRYLLVYTETWARSYAQYIAVKANDLILLDQLADERQTGEVIWDLAQWSDQEFEPVMAVIDEVFRRKGWVR